MRICILSEYFYPDSTGGTGTVLSKLIRHLKDNNDHLEIDVIASRNLFRGEVGKLSAREEWEGVNIFRLKAPAPRKKSVKRRLAANMVFTARAFMRLMTARRKYDLVMVVTAPPTLPLAAKLFSGLTKTPYVYLVYDLYLDMAIAMKMVSPTSRITKTFRKVQKGWFHGAARTVVLGRCMRDHVSSTYSLDLEKIGVIPIPSNLDMIVPMPKETTKFRSDNGIKDFLVLYAGNFAQYQDFDTLLDAAKLLGHRSDITFAFVGDGAKKEYIANRVAKENLSNVKMLPFVPEEQLCDMLASADVSLVTLERGIEGLAVPSKFYNIMASGRATVACVPSASEVAHVIAESDCGVQVDQEDAGALAAALERLANDPQSLERMGANARRVCEENYGFNQIGKKFLNIFNDVAASNSQGLPSGKGGTTPLGAVSRTK
ncbi:glycosyltransferase WbuB [bacterium]|nr:MAG: glycosyltransferase WbuB [bacterium]